MKRKTLLSLTASALILMAGFGVKGAILPGASPFTFPGLHYPGCELPPPIGNRCSSLWSPATHWIDPPLAIVTWLDWFATKDQYEKSVNADEALEKLNAVLGPGCDGDAEDGSNSSLTPTDNLPVAPDVVTSLLDNDGDSFEAVRVAAETYLSESDDCNQDCMVQRQNEWLLTSLALAVGASDKLLSASDDMSKEYGDLLKDFNSQTGPKGMWGSSSQITLHTHVQQNDINALYARDLEINALNGVRETVKIDCEHKVGDKPCPNVARHRVPKAGNNGYSWFCQQHAPKK